MEDIGSGYDNKFDDFFILPIYLLFYFKMLLTGFKLINFKLEINANALPLDNNTFNILLFPFYIKSTRA